jgi:hypothetical protein
VRHAVPDLAHALKPGIYAKTRSGAGRRLATL